jgi:hypothetical protein
VIEEGGVKVVEGVPNEHFMSRAADADRVVEACFSSGARCALLYAQNMTSAFFDLSSGDAGAILQKLRNYKIRLAVVCPPDRVPFSSRFPEMVAEERRGPHFGLFDTREAARAWLGR